MEWFCFETAIDIAISLTCGAAVVFSSSPATWIAPSGDRSHSLAPMGLSSRMKLVWAAHGLRHGRLFQIIISSTVSSRSQHACIILWPHMYKNPLAHSKRAAPIALFHPCYTSTSSSVIAYFGWSDSLDETAASQRP